MVNNMERILQIGIGTVTSGLEPGQSQEREKVQVVGVGFPSRCQHELDNDMDNDNTNNGSSLIPWGPLGPWMKRSRDSILVFLLYRYYPILNLVSS